MFVVVPHILLPSVSSMVLLSNHICNDSQHSAQTHASCSYVAYFRMGTVKAHTYLWDYKAPR